MRNTLYPKHVTTAKVEIMNGKHKGNQGEIYSYDNWGYCRVMYLDKTNSLIRVQLHCKNLKLI